MRTEHAGHDHTHGMAKQTLRLAFFLTLFILAAELIGGFVANSLALLSDPTKSLSRNVVASTNWIILAEVLFHQGIAKQA